METQKTRNTISITNKSGKDLTLIVEYIHWVEELPWENVNDRSKCGSGNKYAFIV